VDFSGGWNEQRADGGGQLGVAEHRLGAEALRQDAPHYLRDHVPPVETTQYRRLNGLVPVKFTLLHLKQCTFLKTSNLLSCFPFTLPAPLSARVAAFSSLNALLN